MVKSVAMPSAGIVFTAGIHKWKLVLHCTCFANGAPFLIEIVGACQQRATGVLHFAAHTELSGQLGNQCILPGSLVCLCFSQSLFEGLESRPWIVENIKSLRFNQVVEVAEIHGRISGPCCQPCLVFDDLFHQSGAFGNRSIPILPDERQRMQKVGQGGRIKTDDMGREFNTRLGMSDQCGFLTKHAGGQRPVDGR